MRDFIERHNYACRLQLHITQLTHRHR